MRETSAAKAARYLAEGRVILLHVWPGMVDATVRGAGTVYSVTYRRGGWSCDCPARGRCCHLTAVMLVTAPDVALTSVRRSTHGDEQGPNEDQTTRIPGLRPAEARIS